ncbi:glycerate kinase [Herbiconiux liukaitaii]|uniref:glycerate kinase n=1 Tax=Herbiconiux liukaitaii TaxID=3342799 RepID=UPI0035BACD36
MSSRVVIAPDSFKGTATAVEAAEWLAEGWLSERPHDVVERIPMADGGEGALDAFEIARPDAQRMPVTVTGPDDRVISATWLWLPPVAAAGAGVESVTVGGGAEAGADVGAGGRLGGTAVVELACTSGITLLDRLRPLEAHTIGFGQAIRAALDAGVDAVVLAIGGSSSTDGGAGALEVLGASFTGDDGRHVAPGNGGLASIRRADLAGLRDLPPEGVTVLSDVDNPLLGRRGAVGVFGLQKGIGEALEAQAEANLAVFARVLSGAAGIDPETPGAGAAGGTGFGLLAWGARLTPGAAAVAELLQLPQRLVGADVVVTGEGRFDDQSESGKVPGAVRDLARAAVGATAQAGPRVALVAGSISGPTESFDEAVSLTELAGSAEAAMADPRPHLVAAGAALARAFTP